MKFHLPTNRETQKIIGSIILFYGLKELAQHAIATNQWTDHFPSDAYLLCFFFTIEALLHYQLGHSSSTTLELLDIRRWHLPSFVEFSFIMTSVYACSYLVVQVEYLLFNYFPDQDPEGGTPVLPDTVYTRGLITCVAFWLEALLHFNIGRNSDSSEMSDDDDDEEVHFSEDDVYDSEEENAFEDAEEAETGDGVMPDNVPLQVSPPQKTPSKTKKRSTSKKKKSTKAKTKTSVKKETNTGAKKATKKKNKVKYSRTTTLVESLRHPEEDEDVSLVLRPRHRTGGISTGSTRSSSRRRSTRNRTKVAKFVATPK